MENYRKILIIQGDITEQEVDVIVNAANPYLKHGGGVALAIVRKGGNVIQEESDKIGYVPEGEIAVTSAGKLKAKYVIHAVGPRDEKEENKLKSCISKALEKADSLGCSSIAIPAVSTGIFGFPKEKGTKIILNQCLEFLRKKAVNLMEIRLVDIDPETPKFYLRHLSFIGL